MIKLLVTGGTGFIGRNLVESLLAKPGYEIVVSTRRPPATCAINTARFFTVRNIGPETEWGGVLSGINCVVHAAGRAHVLKDESKDPLAAFRYVNVEGTLNLARQAATQGVRRFIFLSSIGVNGNINVEPFSPSDGPAPVEPYAVSKFEAENGLKEIQDVTGMEVVVIRPPLVYGPDAPGNFGLLAKAVSKGYPLPLACITNRRSLISVWNLVDLIITCIHHPAAANQTFLASDGEDISTAELVQRMGKAFDKPARLIPFPEKLIWLGARLLGRESVAQRLCGSLQVDIQKTRSLLGWTPPISLDQALAATAERYLKTKIR